MSLKGVRKSTIPLRTFLKGDERTVNNISYVLELGERGNYSERSSRVFEELSDIYSNFLNVWAGLLDTSFGLKFDFRAGNRPELGRKFFEQLKNNWESIVEKVKGVNFSRAFLIGEDRLVCEIVYVIFYLNSYAMEKRCEVWSDVSRMLNELLIGLSSSPEKLSGLIRHYRNSKMFSERAYLEVLRRIRCCCGKAYALHCMECIDTAEVLAERDFPGVKAFAPLMKLASNKSTIERVLRITRTDIVSEVLELSEGYDWKIDVSIEEDGIKWGAVTVLLILLNDSASTNVACSKLLESMLDGNYSFSLSLFFYPRQRKLKAYVNDFLVLDSEFDVLSKFIEDLSEYIYPAVERLSDSFLKAFEEVESIPDCGVYYDYVVDAVRMRVRKKLATHLEYTCLITKPVMNYYLHFIVLNDGNYRYFCLACVGSNVKPKDAFYMFDNAELKKIFEVVRAGDGFKLKAVSFEELKKVAENSKETERKLARIKLKEAGIVVR